MRGYFVTGTDTGVGKTVLSAALAIRCNAVYWKPIQTGPDDDTAEVQRLSGCEVLPCGIHLPEPVSPHLAAQLANTSIDLPSLISRRLDLQASTRVHIVEGAGGALVPINSSETMADLMSLLALPVIIAARTTLGTINHTLLTIEALRVRSLTIAGVVMIGEPNAANRLAVEHYGKVAILAEMPRLDPLTPDELRNWALSKLTGISR